MAHYRMTPRELLDHLGSADIDGLRTIAEHALQRLIEVEATAHIGADHGERADSRVTQRNGYRPKTLDTRVGRLELQIPKVRTGSFFPSLLEPRRRIERALLAVVQEAYVHGVSTRKVDDLVAAMGGCHISKSEVSRICVELDEELAAFRDRVLDDGSYAYVWFDATYQKVRDGGRIVSQAAVVAVGVRDSGEKSILGVAIGPSETEAFWLDFCRRLVARGLTGVHLVISDAHEGLRSALATCFVGAAWQRCKVHFLRNVASAVPKQHAPAVLAVIKAIFLQPNAESAKAAVTQALAVLEPRFPQVAEKLRTAEADVLAYLAFPAEHWRSISSTNTIERVNAELDRRAKVVGIFLRLYASARLWRDHRPSCEATAGPRVTRHFSVEPSGSDSVRASPLGPRGWPSDLIAA